MTDKAKKATPVSKLSFGEAVGEVEEILTELERDNVDIDHLGENAVEQLRRERRAKTRVILQSAVAPSAARIAASGELRVHDHVVRVELQGVGPRPGQRGDGGSRLLELGEEDEGRGPGAEVLGQPGHGFQRSGLVAQRYSGKSF